MSELFAVENLRVSIPTRDGLVEAVRGLSLTIEAGETVALVGESGCGKSMTALGLMGLLPRGAHLAANRWRWCGADRSNSLQSGEAGMIFQQPLSALNPTMKVGAQIAEVLRLRRGMGRREARVGAVELLERMQISHAAERAEQYPFQFSGGMLQRVMIAMALALKPKLLIADEPTTALDVTVQSQVLTLLQELQREEDLALLLITHDFGVVARMAQRVMVMYAGEVIEEGDVDQLFYHPAHPYTQGLQAAVPSLSSDSLNTIAGTPPALVSPPAGCAFAPRCDRAMKLCCEHSPTRFELAEAHTANCWLHHPQRRSV